MKQIKKIYLKHNKLYSCRRITDTLSPSIRISYQTVRRLMHKMNIQAVIRQNRGVRKPETSATNENVLARKFRLNGHLGW